MKCLSLCCNGKAGLFGVCKKHEAGELSRAFRHAVNDGIASLAPPPCFTHQQWKEYVVAHRLSQHSGRGETAVADPCRDCTTKHRDMMAKQGACSHPETVFVRDAKSKAVVGYALHDPRKPRMWEQAIMGMYGQVVGMPASRYIDAATRQIDGAKRGPGRPRKEEV